MSSTETLRVLAQARGTWKPTDYSTRLLVTEQRLAIASDVHLPYHDEKLLARFLDQCRDQSVDAIIWLGDLLDLPTFSSWGRTDYSTTFEREIGIARTVLELAADRVPVQYWSRGNHEERLFRKVDNQFGMQALARMLGLGWMLDDGQLIVSDNPTLDAIPVRGKPTWMLTHPAKYGAKPLTFPAELALRYQQNIMSAHAHHWGMSTDPTGHYLVVETGGMFDPRYHEYVQRRVTGHRAWASGYWILDGGQPHGYLGGHLYAAA